MITYTEYTYIVAMIMYDMINILSNKKLIDLIYVLLIRLYEVVYSSLLL